MLDDHGYGLSRRRVTVSTSGVVPMIDRLRAGLPGGAGRVAARAERRAARRAGAAQPQVPARELLAACQRYLDMRAARLHHVRILHARRRQRQRPSMRASWSRWCSAARRAVQGQPDPVQPVSRSRA